MRFARLALVAVVAALLPVGCGRSDAPETDAGVTVGMEGRTVVEIAGPAVEAAAVDEKSPVIVRVDAVSPRDGGGRYDVRYIALEPGTYDLRDYLVRSADGSPLSADAAVPPVEVAVGGLLPPGGLGELESGGPVGVGRFGGYALAASLVAALWATLLVPLLVIGRRRRAVAPAAEVAPPPTVAEQIRPLAERAAAGSLSGEEKGRLERLLLAFWRDRLGLADLPMADAVARLRADPEAGRLLRSLDAWLHRRPGAEPVDLAAVMRPYREGG